jgi:group I intron endonuclease
VRSVSKSANPKVAHISPSKPATHPRRQMIVYKISNKKDGKVYIGITSQSLERRVQQHLFCVRQGVNSKLYNAIRKHGISSFKIDPIDKAVGLEELKYLEQMYIADYDSYRSGYNLTLGGEGTIGYVPTEETRRKLAELRVGWKHSEETKAKQSKARIGKPNHSVSGEKHPSAKLTDTQRLEIALIYETSNTSLSEIARMYDINKASAYSVVKKFFKNESLEAIGPKKRPFKLSASDIEKIRRRYIHENVTQKRLSEDYGVSSSIINRIVKDLPKNTGWRKSEKAPGAKISDSTKLIMYEEYKNGAKHRDLAEKYGVSEITISRLVQELGSIKTKTAGATHFNSKITAHDRKLIFEEWLKGNSTKTQIAKKYGISNSRVGQLIKEMSKERD